MTRRLAELGILVFWLAMSVSLVVRQTGLWDPPSLLPPGYEALLARSPGPSVSQDAFEILLDGRPAGLATSTTTRHEDGSATLESTVRLENLGVPMLGEMDATVTVEVDAAHQLGQLAATVRSAMGTFQMEGYRTGPRLVISTYRGSGTDRVLVGTSDVPYDPRAALGTGMTPAEGLIPAPGRRWRIPYWNPLTHRGEELRAVVVNREPVPYPPYQGTEAWRVEVQGSGFGQATAWVDDAGELLAQRGPLALVLIRVPTRAPEAGR